MVFKTQICQPEFDFCESRGFEIRPSCRTHRQRSIARALASLPPPLPPIRVRYGQPEQSYVTISAGTLRY